MALLNNLFDILRGWPHGGAIDTSWPVHVTGGTPDVLPPGAVVKIGAADGAAILASTPDMSTTDAVPTWVVIESNMDFSGQFLSKVVCLRANAVFRLDPSNIITSASWAVGALCSFSAGQWKYAAANDQVIGEVLVDNRAVDGTMQVYYHGGYGIKK
jgi:hypothetical protein